MSEATDRLEMSLDNMLNLFGEMGGSLTWAQFDESTDISATVSREKAEESVQTFDDLVTSYNALIGAIELTLQAFKDVRDEIISEMENNE